MQEIEMDDITPEAMLEDMKNKGEIDNDTYKEIKYRFEDIEDAHNLNNYEIYKKAYENNRIQKCVEVLLKLAELETKNLKKAMLLSNCIKNPMGRKYGELDYKKTMIILDKTIKLASVGTYSAHVMKELGEMLLYTHCFYNNNMVNTKRLERNQFSRYSLSKQLRMICIYIQDQSRLMKHNLINERKGTPFVTGMEMNVADKSVDYYTKEKISYADNYEGLLEYFDTIVKYLYYVKRKELKNDDIHEHGDIHHFNIPEFEEIIYIALQRKIYEMIEEKFRYAEWKVDLAKNEHGQNVYVFEPKYIDKYKSHLVGSIRRDYRFKTNIIKYTNSEQIEKSLNAMTILANKIDLEQIEDFHADKKEFEAVCEVANTMVKVYKLLTKEYYLKCKLQNLTVDDIIKMYIFLYTFSQIYIMAVEKKFEQDKYSTYKYLVPVISVDYLISEFSRLYTIEKDKTKKIIDCYIYDEKKDIDKDIFSRPLLKVNKKQVLFCESLVEQMNIERCIEKNLQNFDVDLSPVGPQFEKKLIDHLKDIKGINVNTNHIKFDAYDGRHVEFDFLGTLEDYLLLFEFKSVLIPYDENEVYKREQVIKEGVEQVNRRCDIVQHDWDIIRSMVNIDLPIVPYSDDKIIKIVCTNIYDFTTLRMDGVRITDESTLLKYFTDPFVAVYSKSSEATEAISVEHLWKSKIPTALEFMEYLDNPVTVGNIPQCLEEEIKIIPAFKEDNLIAFSDVFLAKDPYREEINMRRQIIKDKKIYPNDPCPCGSGKKYKKCCRK